MDIGTEFVYEVRETVSDRNCIKIFEERYVLREKKGDELIFSVYKDGVQTDDAFGRESYGNGHIRNGGLVKQSEKTVETRFGTKTLDVYTTGKGFCGGSIRLCQKDLVYFLDEKQMWSMGVIFEKKSELIRTSLLPQD